MALLSSDSPMQQRPASIFGRPPVLLFRFLEGNPEGRRCVAAEFSPAVPRTNDVYNDPCAGYWGQGCKLASRYRFEKFG